MEYEKHIKNDETDFNLVAPISDTLNIFEPKQQRVKKGERIKSHLSGKVFIKLVHNF